MNLKCKKCMFRLGGPHQPNKECNELPESCDGPGNANDCFRTNAYGVMCMTQVGPVYMYRICPDFLAQDCNCTSKGKYIWIQRMGLNMYLRTCKWFRIDPPASTRLYKGKMLWTLGAVWFTSIIAFKENFTLEKCLEMLREHAPNGHLRPYQKKAMKEAYLATFMLMTFDEAMKQVKREIYTIKALKELPPLGRISDKLDGVESIEGPVLVVWAKFEEGKGKSKRTVNKMVKCVKDTPHNRWKAQKEFGVEITE